MRKDYVVSVRFDGDLLEDTRKLAGAAGCSVSDWIRHLVALEAHRANAPAPDAELGRVVGWKCPHMSMTASGVTLGQLTAWCGCEMWPIHENGLAAAA